MRAHDTKTTEDTCELIGDDITEFEDVLRVLGITQPKLMPKALNVPAHDLVKGSPADGNLRKSQYPCGNCGGDHDKRACQYKDEYLQCKTKSQTFWSPQCPHFITWCDNKQIVWRSVLGNWGSRILRSREMHVELTLSVSIPNLIVTVFHHTD